MERIKKSELVIARLYSNSKVARSDAFPAIMHQYNIYGKTLSDADFHKNYIIPLDPNVTIPSWRRFIALYRKEVRARHDAALNKSLDQSVQEQILEETGLKKILAIGNATLEKLLADPSRLDGISDEKKLDWFFTAMRARDSRMGVALKKKDGDRQDSIWGEVLKGAQYGEISDTDMKTVIPERKVIDVPEKKEDINPQPVTGENVVEFDPDQL